MRSAGLGLVVLLTAGSAADPAAAFSARLLDLDAKEAVWWDGFQNRFAAALAKYVMPWERAGSEPDFPPDATYDYAEMRPLYADLSALREARAEAAEALADAGHPEAADRILEELMKVCRLADEAEETLAGKLAEVGHSVFEQRHSVLRHGLDREARRLVPALARCPGAAALLAGEGWKRAEKGDGRSSVLRRVAVLDALALAGGPEAKSFLERQLKAKASTFRIAALEGLLRAGPEAAPGLISLAQDPCPVVRFALLEAVRNLKVPDPRWIRPVLDAYPAATGRMRAEHLATLRRLTGEALADDPGAWKEWWAKHAAAVEGGGFRPPADSPAHGGSATAATACRFYGLSSPTLRPVFVVDGSFVLHLPAEAAIQATKNSRRWEHRPKARWDEPPPVHFSVLRREWRKTLAALPEGSAFALLGLYGRSEAHGFEDGEFVRPDPRVLKDSIAFLEGLGQAGLCGPYEGLYEAMRVAGLDPSSAASDFPKPKADTAFLLHSGSPRGGRYLGWEPVVDAFRRLNRFRRLEVHCVRISIGKDEAERTMKGIADASGGTYVWRDVPPPE